MVQLTEEERKKWYPMEYAKLEAEAAAKKLKEEEEAKKPKDRSPPKIKDIVIKGTYTCQFCHDPFETWSELIVVQGEKPLCPGCVEKKNRGMLLTNEEYWRKRYGYTD